MDTNNELQAMLDERGVEYTVDNGYHEYFWDFGESGRARASYIGTKGLVQMIVTGIKPEQAIAATLGPTITGDTSDGYHTFNELYHHRAVLFSVIVRDHADLAWKSKAHHDGTMYDGMFIVGIETPSGQATYHYDLEPYWDMFECRELDRAPEWDGHTADDAIVRIVTLGRGTCEMEYAERPTKGTLDAMGVYFCSKCGSPTYNDCMPRYCIYCGAEVTP